MPFVERPSRAEFASPSRPEPRSRANPPSGRKVIGIYDPSCGPTGQTRYVEAILGGVDPGEFEVVLFARGDGHYRGSSNLVPISEGPAGPGPGTRGVEGPRAGRLLRAGWGRAVPAPVRLWAGFSRESRRLASVFRRRPVDLFHTNNTGCEESPVGARLAGVPLVLGTFHIDSNYDLEGIRGGPSHRALEWVSNRCLDCGIAVSDATKVDWIRRTGIPESKVVTIRNGIDAGAFGRRRGRPEARRLLGLPDDGRPVIGGVGRLEEAKGFVHLIEAAARIKDRQPGFVVAIAGDGPGRTRLAERAAELGISDRVHFLGFRRDVREVYEALDIFALPSLCEALPYALLEAMASGLPAIGTRVGGVPEVIVPGETGLLTPPADPDSLALAIGLLLDDEDSRHRMGDAGRRRVAGHFGEAETVGRTIGVYRELLGTLARPAVREEVAR